MPPMSLTIVTWNVNSLRSAIRQGVFLGWKRSRPTSVAYKRCRATHLFDVCMGDRSLKKRAIWLRGFACVMRNVVSTLLGVGEHDLEEGLCDGVAISLLGEVASL